MSKGYLTVLFCMGLMLLVKAWMVSDTFYAWLSICPFWIWAYEVFFNGEDKADVELVKQRQHSKRDPVRLEDL